MKEFTVYFAGKIQTVCASVSQSSGFNNRVNSSGVWRTNINDSYNGSSLIINFYKFRLTISCEILYIFWKKVLQVLQHWIFWLRYIHCQKWAKYYHSNLSINTLKSSIVGLQLKYSVSVIIPRIRIVIEMLRRLHPSISRIYNYSKYV